MDNLPLIQPVPTRARPFSLWTLAEKQQYGMGNRKVQWELLRRVSNGMSVAGAAREIGIPRLTLKYYSKENTAFKQRIQKAREWAANKAAN